MIEWLNADRFSLNIDKTNFIIFRPKGKSERCPSIHINGSNNLVVDHAKFLGVIIDNKLNWLEHIKCIARKQLLRILELSQKLANHLNLAHLTSMNLYNALIFPHISYCIHIWATTASIHLQRLYVLQKKEYSYNLWSSLRTHTDTLNILNIDQIRDYSIALLIYKLTNCMLPSMFDNMFIQTSDVHNYSTSQADLLYIPFASTKRTQSTIKHFGAKLWNSLCDVIDIDCAISTFKQRLKIFLLLWYFVSLTFLNHHF